MNAKAESAVRDAYGKLAESFEIICKEENGLSKEEAEKAVGMMINLTYELATHWGIDGHGIANACNNQNDGPYLSVYLPEYHG